MFVSPFHEKGILNLYLLVIELLRLLLYGNAQLNGLSEVVTGVRVTCGTEGVNMEETMHGFLFSTQLLREVFEIAKHACYAH